MVVLKRNLQVIKSQKKLEKKVKHEVDQKGAKIKIKQM